MNTAPTSNFETALRLLYGVQHRDFGPAEPSAQESDDATVELTASASFDDDVATPPIADILADATSQIRNAFALLLPLAEQHHLGATRELGLLILRAQDTPHMLAGIPHDEYTPAVGKESLIFTSAQGDLISLLHQHRDLICAQLNLCNRPFSKAKTTTSEFSHAWAQYGQGRFFPLTQLSKIIHSHFSGKLNDFRNAMSALHAHRSINMVNLLERVDTNALYKQLQAACLPNASHNFGRTLQEASQPMVKTDPRTASPGLVRYPSAPRFPEIQAGSSFDDEPTYLSASCPS